MANRLVEGSHLPVRRPLEELGIPRATFHRWYEACRAGGPEALDDRPAWPGRVWNRIPQDVRGRIVDLALGQPERSPREPAVRFADEEECFVSEVRRVSRQSLETWLLLMPLSPMAWTSSSTLRVDPPATHASWSDPSGRHRSEPDSERHERLLGGLPRLEDGRDVGAGPELRDAQVERSQPRVERALAVPVAAPVVRSPERPVRAPPRSGPPRPPP
jgi:hypothetical protein